MKNTLLTGKTGQLGSRILKTDKSLLCPPKNILDITQPKTIEKFFDNNNINAVIHCAALARMKECIENPIKAIKTNTIGTCNLVNEVIKKDIDIRFIYISTDGVYAGTKGNYSETHSTLPYNIYGWTKLGGECAVNGLKNYCIIRTNFFIPEKIVFDRIVTDSYTSKVSINYLVNKIFFLLKSDFIGTVNVGLERASDYDKYKKFKDVKPIKRKDISFPLPKDSSMDIRRLTNLI